MEAAGKRYIRYGSRSDVFSVWAIGDIHYGNPGCDLGRAQRDLDLIAADPFALWVGIGDYADYISPRDKRFSADSLDDDAKLNIGRLGKFYAEKVRELFRPVRHKCLGLLMGNHEHRYGVDNNQEDLHSWLCSELEVANLRYSSIFDLVFCRDPRAKKPILQAELPHGSSSTLRFFVHHGSGSAATPAGKLNSLIKLMNIVDADIYMCGHVHEQKGQRQVRLAADEKCKKITERQSIGVITGSYLKTYCQGHTGYGEMRAYAPTPLGSTRVQIRPDKREFWGEV